MILIIATALHVRESPNGTSHFGSLLKIARSKTQTKIIDPEALLVTVATVASLKIVDTKKPQKASVIKSESR